VGRVCAGRDHCHRRARRLRLSTGLPLEAENGTVRADFVAFEGARERLTLTWHLSYEEAPSVEDADSALARTETWWREWSERCAYHGPYRDDVLTSLIVLKAMTFETTGAVIAAPTTSLPEDIGGERNWDYRYCWLRDSVLALEALLATGYTEEALGFRDYLLRVGTGDPTKIQIMYGIRGERRLTEFELKELPGYEGSKPVRIGNAASEQFQLDVYGEVLGVFFLGATVIGRVEERFWPRWRTVVDHVETIWREPDDGIWETRGPRRHFTHSKVMAWVVFDRAVRLSEQFGLEAPLDRWRQTREEIHRGSASRATTLSGAPSPSTTDPRSWTRASSPSRSWGSFPAPTSGSPARSTRSRATSAETASSLATRPPSPTTGCPATRDSSSPAPSGWSARSRSTAVSRRLVPCSSGSPAWQTILACWPKWDVKRQRQVGNFPQAFSHLTLIGAAAAISAADVKGAAEPGD
jgi:GH15 family glucan-1,4-alpha-glucosidase